MGFWIIGFPFGLPFMVKWGFFREVFFFGGGGFLFFLFFLSSTFWSFSFLLLKIRQRVSLSRGLLVFLSFFRAGLFLL